MKKVILSVFVVLTLVQFASAAKGVVVYKKYSCDYYIVETTMGFALLEWNGGNDPDIGHTIVGDFESYGMKTLYNLTMHAETRAWVEDYFMSKNSVIREYYDRCR